MALTKEQKELRRKSIGGSDIGTIVGVNPHKSAFRLYLEKIGEDPDEDQQETDAQMFGNIFEEPVAEVYAAKHQVQIHSFTETLVHPEYNFITANPDRISLDLERLLEIKTTGIGGINLWRDPDNPGSLRVPQHVILQVNHYLGLLGDIKEADVVLLNFAESYNFERYYEFPVEFDEELFELSIKLAKNFWINHVQAKKHPEAEDADEVSDYLNYIYQTANQEIISAGKEESDAAARLAHAQSQEKHWKEQKIIEGNILKAKIGDKSGISGDNWIYTWKFTKSSGTDWKAMALSKNPSQAEIDKFTKPGYRRPYFRYKDLTGE
jgi:putative phage-type endonuclease